MSDDTNDQAPELGAIAPTTVAVQPGAIAPAHGEPIINAIVRLEYAQALPEVLPDAVLDPVEHAEGAIEHFVASDTDRRTMRIVGFAGGLACMAVPEPTQE